MNVVGKPVSAAWTASNADTPEAVVTQPDGTPIANTITSSGTTHTVTFTPSQVGHHIIEWETPTETTLDSIGVYPTDLRMVISYADAVAEMGATPASRDEILEYIADATIVVEWLAGDILKRSRTRVTAGGVATILLPHTRVDVTAVTVDGEALAADAYSVDELAGIVTATSGVFAALTPLGVEITYSTGSSVAGANVRRAARELVRHLWASGKRVSAGGGRTAAAGDAVQTPFGFAIPQRVFEQLQPTASTNKAPGFA